MFADNNNSFSLNTSLCFSLFTCLGASYSSSLGHRFNNHYLCCTLPCLSQHFALHCAVCFLSSSSFSLYCDHYFFPFSTYCTNLYFTFIPSLFLSPVSFSLLSPVFCVFLMARVFSFASCK